MNNKQNYEYQLDLKEWRKNHIKSVHNNRREMTSKKVLETIDLMQRKKINITFTSVSNYSGVSKSTLYGNPEFKKIITDLRTTKNGVSRERSVNSKIDEANYKAIIERLKNKIKRLEKENKELRQYIKNYGK